MDLSGKRVTVVGMAKSGQAAARLIKRLGGQVRISDQAGPSAVDDTFLRWVRENGIPADWGHHRDFIEDSDLLVVSPGVRIDALSVRWAREKGIPVRGEIELASSVCPCPMIAVTGSNGKTTVSTLIRDILVRDGRRAVLCGNIGAPFADHVQECEPGGFAVLEISSFQLETIERFKPHVAVFLNFSQNHLDRHQDLEEYLEAKKRIFLNQDGGDVAVLNAADGVVRDLGESLRAKVVYFNTDSADEKTFDPNPNFRAAFQAARAVGVSAESCLEVFRTFRGVEHRMEKVRCLNGVDFINDSKATTAEAGRWALERLEAPVIMICGGRDKHIDFSPLRELVRQKVRTMIVIGEARGKLKEIFGRVVDVREEDTLSGAVDRARDLARPGESVLLSPMCASFDMFRNFEERGRIFKDLVRRLPD